MYFGGVFLVIESPKNVSGGCKCRIISVKRYLKLEKQDAQLSQRDCAAGCVIVFAKSRTLELGDNDLRTL